MSCAKLLINDSRVFLMDGSTYQPIDEAADIPQGSVDIYLNLSDLEIKHSHLPPLGFLDRMRYLRARRQLQIASVLKGYKLCDKTLVEFTCPINDHLNQWLLDLVSHNTQIHSISPLLIIPRTGELQKYTLVISSHGNEDVRQTAFVGKLPIFTRLSHGHSMSEEVQATLSYLKHQYGAENIDMETYCAPSEIAPVKNQGRAITVLNSSEGLPSNEYRFHPPKIIQEQRTKNHLIYVLRAMIITSILAAGTFFWQIYLYRPLQTDLQNKQQQLSLLENKLRDAQASLPLETRLPEPYKGNLKEPSPIGTFMNISIAMVPEIVLSDLKWERTNKEEKILLEVKVINQDEETDQKLDAVKEFCANLKDAMPAFKVSPESLPHATANQETFTGSTNQDDLNLAGDQTRGRILLVRKIAP